MGGLMRGALSPGNWVICAKTGTFRSVEVEDRTLSRSAIESVIGSLVEAWEKGDGAAWGDRFTQDADFTTWFGLRLTGRDSIASGHQEIFDTFYADTVYDLKVESLRFLNDDVALVALVGSVVGSGEQEPSVPQTVPLAVMVKSGAGWKVAAFQNTFSGEIEARRVDGDLRHK